MLLNKKDFIEIYNEAKEALINTEKKQKALDILFPTSYPVYDDCFSEVFLHLMAKITGDEFFYDVLCGSCSRGTCNGKEYNLSNVEEYYDFLTAAENKNGNETTK